MSGIAGIIHFDGAPVEPGQVESMTAAMAHRGPDGIDHWVKGNVGLGQCMLRTTPESLEETQPLTNEGESLVLVMDGRVDNWEELRRELLRRGAVLRTRSDAELVLRAYEVWGEACPDRIIGEYAFFVWDARQKRLFAARDAAGTRHFYYHAGRGWFAFASEIKGLLVLDRIEPKLNESRVFDYLVPAFDRDDVISTFYQGIDRMPAGHAMTVTERGVKTSRYWNPGELSANRFASLDECAEAFLDQMRIAVKCRLRSIGPVGAMLSGGLDSSSIVGMIRKEFRDELSQPLRTISLIRDDRENCKDWEHIQPMLKDGWIEPTIITSASAGDLYRSFLGSIGTTDEPFTFSHGLTYYITYQTARRQGCKVVLDGIAGDLLFYGPAPSLNAVLRSGQYTHIPAVLSAYRHHGLKGGRRALVRRALASVATPALKSVYRSLRDTLAPSGAEVALLQSDFARRMLETKRTRHAEGQDRGDKGSDQSIHAKHFTTGLLAFAHEVYGQIAFSAGVEPRSPFSDRRVIEFAVQAPLQAKLFSDCYKPLLRRSMTGILPDEVRLRRDLGNHPGWRFYERFAAGAKNAFPEIQTSESLDKKIRNWIDPQSLARLREKCAQSQDYSSIYLLLSLTIFGSWLTTHRFIPDRNPASTHPPGRQEHDEQASSSSKTA
jgi:asparagine synthase (glutamine-hydrolysing)